MAASTPIGAPSLPGSLVYEWQWQLPAPVERVWPHVSDTQRINRAIGLPPWHFSEEPDPLGGSVRKGSFRYLGILPIRWDENPYEWVAPREMGVVRVYETGPLAVLASRVTLQPEGGGTKLVHRIEVVPRNLFGRLVAAVEVGMKTRRAFDRVYRRIGEQAALDAGVPFEPEPAGLAPGAAGIVTQARGALVGKGFAGTLVDRLVETLRSAPERELLRMRPFVLARAFSEERLTMLRLMLHATCEGLLEMTWDLVCPQCRGAKERPQELSALKNEAHCSSCNIRFGPDFDKSVEVTFRPAAGVRPILASEYCVGGPGNTRHVVVQRRVPSRSRVELPVTLEPGAYRVRGPRTKGSGMLTVLREGATAPLELSVKADDLTPAEARRGPGALSLVVDNAADHEQLVLVERTEWSDDVASASLVTSLQEFRDLFSSQVVSPGTRISIGSIAFLFTDLKSSTAMYEQVGDAQAFALVRDHFHILFQSVSQEQGGVVKTIGDAVMASFTDPANALRASFRMQELMRSFNEREKPPYPIHLKIGVHAGPCIAVNLNDRLDYFGTTVNMAARIQNESLGDDIVVLESLLEHPNVKEFLRDERFRTEPFETELKGLTGRFRLQRIYLAPEQGGRRPGA